MKDFACLDDCVLNALKLFENEKVPRLGGLEFKRPLIVGSGNAITTGKIIFDNCDAVFADESSYMKKVESCGFIDGVVVISASGEKHAPIIAKSLRQRGLKIVLMTCNSRASAGKFADKIIVFPKNDEIYSYNTSTYLGMILGKTKENPEEILGFLKKAEKKIDAEYKKYDSFFIIVPEKFDEIREMFLKKFGELFGARISVRVFTPEQAKHGETIVPYEKEMFIGLGYKNITFGKNRLNIDIPDKSDYGLMLCLGYTVIGKIQRQNRGYFKENIDKYIKSLPKMFKSL